MKKTFSAVSIKNAPQKIAILLCTYNGEKFLPEQLDSFVDQTYSNWEVWASDDGSQDTTRAMLDAYRAQWPAGRLNVHTGPGQGFASNFLSLLEKVDGHADFYAYSDQDDIWEPQKLERAVKWLQTISPLTPALYCSASTYIDENGEKIGASRRFQIPPSFQNALVQNIAGGNTMVFNQAARDILTRNSRNKTIPFHDWWTYLLVTGYGGTVHYDPHATLRYRQHGHNLAGENISVSALWCRLKALQQGTLKKWIDQNEAALIATRAELTERNKAVFDIFHAARRKPLLARIRLLLRSGVHRQTLLGNIGIGLASFFNRL